MSNILWQADETLRQRANITRFIQKHAKPMGLDNPNYDQLWQWSVDRPDQFWQEMRVFMGLIDEGSPLPVIEDADKMPGAKFFPNLRLNFAENLLRRRDDSEAIIFRSEDKIRRRMTWRELYDLVSRLVIWLKRAGLKPGDRVAGFVPNMPETIAAMLATTALGGIWTSCSPDFGRQGVLDRFGQTGPRFLFCADGYYYNGKANQSIPRVAEFSPELPDLEAIIVFPLLADGQSLRKLPKAQWLDDALQGIAPNTIDFERFPFNHPLYVMYTSGTTGQPKCIIHGAGGALLMHAKEHQLHCDIKPDDRVFFFTTCGWMMWNWLVTALASEACLMLYDGSPFYPSGQVLFDYAAEENWSQFGTSAKFIDACLKANLKPIESHQFPRLRLICSTGSPLAPEGFDYIYNQVKTNVQLASMSGGTDLLGCFLIGTMLKPVRRGEIQAPALGMAVDIFDEEGQSVRQTQGDLVCTKPFPTLPLGFWGENGEARYHAAYFENFPNVWTHGDFVEMTEHGGYIIYGRSDATLNPGGVRIGTAEIYNQVETLEEIQESIVIGQNWDNDVRVVLFVRLKPSYQFSEELQQKIRQRIRQNCTPRHVPARILVVNDIPRTRSGKITELAVRDIVHGRTVKNSEALANPEALLEFQNRPELAC